MKPLFFKNRINGLLLFGILLTTICSASLLFLPIAFGNQITFTVASETTLNTEIVVYWNETYAAPFVDEAQSIIKHPVSGYVVAGWTNSSGAGDLDVFILRIANDGTHIWNKTIGNVNEDKGFQVINCASGGYAVASTFTNTTAFVDNTDFLVTRLADDGTFLWSHTYSGPKQNATRAIGDLGRSIVECPNGDFVLGGVTYGVNDDCDIWMFRISSTGTRLWERTFDNRDIDRCYNPHSLVMCSDGGFAVLGYTYNSTTSNDVWLIKTNSIGIHQWNKTFGDEGGYQRPEGLVECSDGGFAIIANTQSFGAGGADAWIIRTDSYGNQLWNQTYGGVEEDGGGYIFEMADGGFTIGGGTHSYDLGNGDAWILRTDENGTLLWNHTVGDLYGNSITSFVYDGSNTYTCAGGTMRLGETFGDIWVFKCFVQIITPTTTPTYINSLPNVLITTIFLAVFIFGYKTKKRKIN